MLRIGADVGINGLFEKPRNMDVLALTWVNLQVLQLKDWKEMQLLYPKETAAVERKLKEHDRKMQAESLRVKVNRMQKLGFVLEETPREGGAIALLKEAGVWTGKKTAAAKNWDTVRSKFLLGRKSFLGRMSTGRITIDVSKDAAKVAAANEKAWKVLPAGEDYEEDA